MGKKKKLKELSLEELLVYNEAVKYAEDYYHNLMMANDGLYDEYAEKEKGRARDTREKYRKILNIIFEEIKKRIDELALE